MKKKKKSLSEQKNQVIPRRKINPFRKGLSNDVSTPRTPSNISAGSSKVFARIKFTSRWCIFFAASFLNAMFLITGKPRFFQRYAFRLARC